MEYSAEGAYCDCMHSYRHHSLGLDCEWIVVKRPCRPGSDLATYIYKLSNDSLFQFSILIA